jgi:L-arabinose isomerase
MIENDTKVGVVGFGLETYWPQFDGLLDKLNGFQNQICQNIQAPGAKIINAGIVDNHDKAMEVAESLQRENVDALFVYLATYSLSSVLLPIVQTLKVPVILLNLQPAESIDYEYVNGLGDRGKMTGEWLSFCQACSIPEYASVMNRAGVPYRIVTGHLKDESVWKELKEWINAACVVSKIRKSSLGILGHYYCGMLDVYTDLAQMSSTFGINIELIEMCELKAFRDHVSSEEIKKKLLQFNETFNVSNECSEFELERAAKTSVALDNLVDRHRLGALAYYYEGQEGNEYQDIVTSMIPGCTLLTGNNVPTAGECEVKNAIAMKLLSLLGVGGSFSEFYAMDFNDDVVLLGHDGPAHFNMSEEKVGLVPVPVYHGKPGKGLSIQMSVRHGPVTLLSVCDSGKGVTLLTAEGESVEGPVLEIGNTNSRYRFSCGVREFMEEWSQNGPSHHCAIGVGHVASELKKIAFLAGVQLVQVC